MEHLDDFEDVEKRDKQQKLQELKRELENSDDKYSKEYSEEKLMKKLQKFAKKLGLNTVYHVLLLYYVLLSNDVPLKEKGLIISALGYLILPIDLIPDAIPVLGLSDDAAALLYAIHAVRSYITPEIKEQAKNKLRDWFGDYDETELSVD